MDTWEEFESAIYTGAGLIYGNDLPSIRRLRVWVFEGYTDEIRFDETLNDETRALLHREGSYCQWALEVIPCNDELVTYASQTIPITIATLDSGGALLVPVLDLPFHDAPDWLDRSDIE